MIRWTIAAEIAESESLLDMAVRKACNAWIADDKREQDKWDHYADVMQARIEYLYSIANKGA